MVTHKDSPKTAVEETKSDNSGKCSAVGVVKDVTGTGSGTAKTDGAWIMSICFGGFLSILHNLDILLVIISLIHVVYYFMPLQRYFITFIYLSYNSNILFLVIYASI